MKKEIKLEPLIGHLRHPYGLGSCVPDGEQVGFSLSIKSVRLLSNVFEHFARTCSAIHKAHSVG